MGLIEQEEGGCLPDWVMAELATFVHGLRGDLIPGTA
jgi:hypothetical protein